MQKLQNRGICQCCGREWAVLASGLMSKHGYEVNDGWFQGVCQGQKYEPIEVKRDIADSIVASVRRDVVSLKARAAALLAGEIFPEQAFSGKYQRGKKIMCAFADAEPWYRLDAVKSTAWNCEQRARMGEDFANMLAKRIVDYHGQPVKVVVVAAAPERIQPGEKRDNGQGRILIAQYQDGANVRWKDERGFGSKMGVQSWRRLKVVE